MKLHHLFATSILCSLLAWSACSGALQSGKGTTQETLSADPSWLKDGCSIEQHWVGSVFYLPEGLWLSCGGEAILITHPLNLFQKVEIGSEAEALEFVRFFSEGGAHLYFPLLEGLMELTPDFLVDWGLAEIPEVDEAVAQGAPEVRMGRMPLDCEEDAECGEVRTIRRFEIRRTVIFYDQAVYRSREFLTEDGFYTLEKGEPLVRDLDRWGFLHTGHY